MLGPIWYDYDEMKKVTVPRSDITTAHHFESDSGHPVKVRFEWLGGVKGADSWGLAIAKMPGATSEVLLVPSAASDQSTKRYQIWGGATHKFDSRVADVTRITLDDPVDDNTPSRNLRKRPEDLNYFRLNNPYPEEIRRLPPYATKPHVRATDHPLSSYRFQLNGGLQPPAQTSAANTVANDIHGFVTPNASHPAEVAPQGGGADLAAEGSSSADSGAASVIPTGNMRSGSTMSDTDQDDITPQATAPIDALRIRANFFKGTSLRRVRNFDAVDTSAKTFDLSRKAGAIQDTEEVIKVTTHYGGTAGMMKVNVLLENMDDDWELFTEELISRANEEGTGAIMLEVRSSDATLSKASLWLERWMSILHGSAFGHKGGTE